MRPLAILLLLGEQVGSLLNSTHRAGTISTCCSPCSWLCPCLVEIRLQRGPSTAGLWRRMESAEASTQIWGMRAQGSAWSALGPKDCTALPGPSLLSALLWRARIHLERHSSELSFLLYRLGGRESKYFPEQHREFQHFTQ